MLYDAQTIINKHLILLPTLYTRQPETKYSHLELISIYTMHVVLRTNIDYLDFHLLAQFFHPPVWVIYDNCLVLLKYFSVKDSIFILEIIQNLFIHFTFDLLKWFFMPFKQIIKRILNLFYCIISYNFCQSLEQNVAKFFIMRETYMKNIRQGLFEIIY